MPDIHTFNLVFHYPDVLVQVMDVSILGLAILMVIAAYLGRHSVAVTGGNERQG